LNFELVIRGRAIMNRLLSFMEPYLLKVSQSLLVSSVLKAYKSSMLENLVRIRHKTRGKIQGKDTYARPLPLYPCNISYIQCSEVKKKEVLRL
jgi:hypothetical protein